VAEDFVVKKFTFAISSPDEYLVIYSNKNMPKISEDLGKTQTGVNPNGGAKCR